MHFSYQFGHFRRRFIKGFRHVGWLTLKADTFFAIPVDSTCLSTVCSTQEDQAPGRWATIAAQRHRSQFRLRGGGPRSPFPAACPQRLPLSATRAGCLSPRSYPMGGVFSPSPLLVYDNTPLRPSVRGDDCRGRPATSVLPPPRRPQPCSRWRASAPNRSVTPPRPSARGAGLRGRPAARRRGTSSSHRCHCRHSKTPPQAGWQERAMYCVMLCVRPYLHHAQHNTQKKVFCWTQNFLHNTKSILLNSEHQQNANCVLNTRYLGS